MIEKRSPADPADSSGLEWRRAWPAVILISTVAAGVASLLSLPPAVRAPLVLWFAAMCPGLALVRLLHFDDRLIEVVLAVALSIAVDGIVAAAFLYSGHWSPPAIMASLIAITICALGLEWILSSPGRRRSG
jgi:uncharacterized membrane protein